MKDLTGFYDQLTSEERFSAFIAASSRMDGVEMDALNDTCPRKTYTMDDWVYTRQKIRFFNCSHWIQMRMSRITTALSGLAIAALYAGDEVAEKSVEAARKVIMTYHMLRAAWKQFCEQVGVDRSVGIALLDSDTDELRDFFLDALDEEAIGEISKPSAESIAREVETLMQIWR